MRGKNKYLKYINFTPIKLKIFKSENFSIHTTPEVRKHKSSFSFKIKNRRKLPSENFLFDKINVSNLSKSKILLDKSIKNEEFLRNSHYSTNKNTRSVDSTLKRVKKNERIRSKYNCNFTYNFKKNYYSRYKNKTPIRPHNFLNLDEDIKRNNNPVAIYIVSRLSKNSDESQNYFSENNNENDNNYLILLKKIILIQSFWRSYYLRKLVVGGLEKYYSSIALAKYLGNIFYKMKKSLFPIFIEKIKDYIISKKFSCFKNNRNKNNNIKFFFDGNNDSMSIEIPNDKKKDCIYYFIKKEQKKSNIFKDKKNSNKKEILLNNNIKDYKWQKDKRSRNDNKKKIVSLYNKKNNNLKNGKFNDRVNIKINLINHNNTENNKKFQINKANLIRNKFNGAPKMNVFLNPKKKSIIEPKKSKNIYIKKKVGEESSNKILTKGNSATLINFRSKKRISKKINAKKFISTLNIIRNKFLYFYFLLFINNLKINKTNKKYQIFFLKIFEILRRNILKKYFNILKNNSINKSNKNLTPLYSKKEINDNAVFPKRSITYYRKKNSKYNYAKLNKNDIHKIKVNKNNQIEKNKKLKLLKKIIEKKIKNTHEVLSQYFSKFIKNPRIPVVHFEFKTNAKSKTNNLKRIKSENMPKKGHIKIKYKKSSSNNKTFCSNSSNNKRNYLSNSCKKMKISKKIYDINTFYSTISNEIDSKCMINLFNRIIKKDYKFFNKVVNLIKKLENKNILYKYFTDWKKESKNKK